MNAQVSTSSHNERHIFSRFLRIFVFSLFAAALPISLLNAQTVAYVVNGNNAVSVIDTSTNTVTASIPVGNGPLGVVFSPDGTRAYVTNGSDDTISVIDTGANSVIATIVLGTNDNPGLPAITPDGKSLYVPGQGNRVVQVVDTATNTVVATIAVPCANAVAITPDGAHAYVQCLDPPIAFSDEVAVIDTASNAVTSVISGIPSELSTGIAVTPNGGSVYVTGGFDPVVSAIATSSNTLSSVIPLPFQGFAEGIVFTPGQQQSLFHSPGIQQRWICSTD